jgi:hypothetical protein
MTTIRTQKANPQQALKNAQTAPVFKYRKDEAL